MKRTLVTLAFGALALLVLGGFSLLGLAIQTPRVRWHTSWQSTAPARRGVNFSGTFTGSGSVAGGVSFGPASWRMGGVECRSLTPGSTDGGTNELTVRIVHEDGGEDCTCSLGTTACTETDAGVSCDCPAGIVELQGSRWNLQIAGDAGCIAVPGSIECDVDVFR